MSDEMRKLKYPSRRAPKTVLTNEAGTINLALSHTNDKVAPSQLTLFGRSMENTLKPRASKWIGTQQRTINGTDWVVLEFHTAAIDTGIQNLMAFTSLDGRTLVFSFNATEKEAAEWWPVAEAVVDSLRLQP